MPFTKLKWRKASANLKGKGELGEGCVDRLACFSRGARMVLACMLAWAAFCGNVPFAVIPLSPSLLAALCCTSIINKAF
jgi:hypothetical protein